MLILKSQTFSEEELREYALGLSSMTGGPENKLLHWDFGPIMTMTYDRRATNYLFSDEKVPLHWDGAFYREPKKLLFYCTESEGAGGETVFTDTGKVWRALRATEQALCRKVKLRYRTQKLAHYGGEIEVDLVQNHPETGEEILRLAERVESILNPVDLEITGVDKPEELYSHLVGLFYLPENLYVHPWEKGDLLICDNFTYLHGRRELGANKKRTFKRIQIL